MLRAIRILRAHRVLSQTSEGEVEPCESVLESGRHMSV